MLHVYQIHISSIYAYTVVYLTADVSPQAEFASSAVCVSTYVHIFNDQ